MYRPAFVLLVLRLSMGPALGAQTESLRGSVRDSLGSPLVGAQVQLHGPQQTVLSDAKGHFRFDSVAPGSYTLEVRYLAYRTVWLPVQVPCPAPVTVVLAPQLVDATSRELPAPRLTFALATGLAAPDPTTAVLAPRILYSSWYQGIQLVGQVALRNRPWWSLSAEGRRDLDRPLAYEPFVSAGPLVQQHGRTRVGVAVAVAIQRWSGSARPFAEARAEVTSRPAMSLLLGLSYPSQ